jgi:hypothetical protein
MPDFGPIIDQARISNQHSNRSYPITRVIWHHQASTNDDGTIDMMVSGSKQVSSTYTVDNKDYQGRGWARITGVVPERYRPWTSSSWADGGAITIEVCNSTGNPAWGISDVTHEACAHIAAYVRDAYGVPLQRATSKGMPGHVGHNEVQRIFGESYPTFCPGNLDINRIIARAQQLGAPTSEEDDMSQQDIEWIKGQLNEIRRLTASTMNPEYARLNSAPGEYQIADQVALFAPVPVRPYGDNPADQYSLQTVLSELLELCRNIRDVVTPLGTHQKIEET